MFTLQEIRVFLRCVKTRAVHEERKSCEQATYQGKTTLQPLIMLILRYFTTTLTPSLFFAIGTNRS